jgi:proteasome accessory factor B
MSTRLVNRSERLAEIERMLFHSATGLRVVEIAESCGVDRRTIYRDLSLLNDLGLPVYQKDGRFHLNHEYYVATVRLNLNEAVALLIAARTFMHAAEHHNPHLTAALKKLSQILPESVASHVMSAIDATHGDPVDRAFVATLETLTRAWAERRKVKLWYRNTNSTTTRARDFAIYLIEATSTGSLYAVGYDFGVQHVSAFKLQRIKRVQLLQARYEIAPSLDRRRYLAGIWGMTRGEAGGKPVEVVLAFSADITPMIREKARHTAQRITILDDHRCIVRFLVSDWREFLPWLRSLGTQVEVLEPEALRNQIAAEAVKIAALYEAGV